MSNSLSPEEPSDKVQHPQPAQPDSSDGEDDDDDDDSSDVNLVQQKHSISSKPNPSSSSVIKPVPAKNSLNPPTLMDHHQAKKAYNKFQSATVKYMECLKNHAAAIGGNATDGCGEFLPGGEQGTIEALKCAACNCHRNFHRKIQLETNSPFVNKHAWPHHSLGLVHQEILAMYPNAGTLISSSRSMQIMSYHQMKANEDEETDHEVEKRVFVANPGDQVRKKRFRTRFTQEQKEKMLSFAEENEWTLRKLDENAVREFCQQIGIKKRALKTWMHNNKYN